jgi:hypothetical protein
MSDLAPSRPTFIKQSSWIALALAVASIVAWVVAAGGADELWLGAAFLGLVAAGLAWRSRREATRAGGSGTLALVAVIAGGLVAAQVIAFTIGWGIYHLVT